MARTTTPPELRPMRICTSIPCVAAGPRYTGDRRLHGERRIARPHRVVFMGDRRPKQRHDPIAHDLIDGAFIAVHGRHHVLQDGVENRPGVFGVALGQQLHGAFEIRKQHGHLLALAFEGGAGGEDLVGQVWWRVGERRLRRWCKGCGDGGGRRAGERSPTFAAKRKPRRIHKTAARAVHRRPLIFLVATRYIKQPGQTIDEQCGALPDQLLRRSPHCFWSLSSRDSERPQSRY